MPQVWLTARRDFTFKNTTHAAGEVFQSSPLEAVQMRAIRAVSFAKKPAAAPEPAPAAAIAEAPSEAPRQRGRPRKTPLPDAPVMTVASAAPLVPAVEASKAEPPTAAQPAADAPQSAPATAPPPAPEA